MNTNAIARIGSMHTVERFETHLRSLGVEIPCDREVLSGSDSPLARPLESGGIRIANRIAVQPMEGWDGAADGNPTEQTLRRWQRFGRSGAKLVWGGEAVAVSHAGRASPNQLVAAEHSRKGLERLRSALLAEHRQTTGSDDGLLVGLQLTHSGRFSRPNLKERAEPRILYRHPILDRRTGLPNDYPILSDFDIEQIIGEFHRAASIAWELGFDFVDVKHCHGYLGHEFLSAHTREGKYGGSFGNRTRFLHEVVEGIRASAPGLQVGVRLSAFDVVPFKPDPELSSSGKPGPGIPEDYGQLLPYRFGFGVNQQLPIEPDLREPIEFLSLLKELDIRLVNLTAGSPYYNPHVQRPALYPPSDGYLPPEDPLAGVARQLTIARDLKAHFPEIIFVGSGYSYLQDFLPAVAQAAVREDWIDFIGLGRVVLSYPEILWDALQGQPMQRKRICRTFSDCTTAPRNGLPSGCYPLDPYYKDSELGELLRNAKTKSNPATRPNLDVASEALTSIQEAGNDN
ncbi:MAG: NADH:flavin oxidoreductase [Acidobacteria bacterium]|nr:MAG: NADH:flavin oxidoreductase [Acidobacteriota bacterium]PYY21937.1 MAG: NADH:flavin oxidoreductase [Acidobacteriota bacterium]